MQFGPRDKVRNKNAKRKWAFNDDNGNEDFILHAVEIHASLPLERREVDAKTSPTCV
jgi:hypothetical protein